MVITMIINLRSILLIRVAAAAPPEALQGVHQRILQCHNGVESASSHEHGSGYLCCTNNFYVMRVTISFALGECLL